MRVEPLARIVREADGVRLKSNENLTLQAARPQIQVGGVGARIVRRAHEAEQSLTGGAANPMNLTGRGYTVQ